MEHPYKYFFAIASAMDVPAILDEFADMGYEVFSMGPYGDKTFTRTKRKRIALGRISFWLSNVDADVWIVFRKLKGSE